MSTENISENGLESEPSPENQTKYADYYEIDKAQNQAGKSESGAAEEVADAGSKSTPTNKEPAKEPVQEQPKPAKQHVPDWQRRIDKQTAIIKQQQAELEAVKKSLKPQKPVMTKDNFVTEQEWIKHEARQEAENVYNAKLAERDEESRKVTEQTAAETAFRQGWVETVRQNFEGDPEALADFKAMTKSPEATDHFSQDIHDYIESTPLGGRMLHVLLHRDDLVDQINNAKPIAKATLLLKLENQVEAYMRSLKQPQPVQAQPAPVARPISKAPAPIGALDTRGAALDEEGTEKAQFNSYMKKKFGIR